MNSINTFSKNLNRLKNFLNMINMINKRVAMTLFIAAALINGVAVAQIRVTQSHTETPQSHTEFCPLFSSPKIVHSSKNAKNTKKNISFPRFSQNFVYLCALKF